MSDIPRYSVTTWDVDEQRYTPQEGLWKSSGLTLGELRQALKQLRRMGYSAWRGRAPDGEYDSDPWVLVEREGGE